MKATSLSAVSRLPPLSAEKVGRLDDLLRMQRVAMEMLPLGPSRSGLEALGGENPPIRVTLGMRLGPQSRSYELLLETPATERELRFKL